MGTIEVVDEIVEVVFDGGMAGHYPFWFFCFLADRIFTFLT